MSLSTYFVSLIRGKPTAVSHQDPFPVEPLGRPGVARQVAAGVAAGSTSLTATVTRISIHARGAALRFAINETATASSHYLAEGERIDVAVPLAAGISAIRTAGVDATLEVTELV